MRNLYKLYKAFAFRTLWQGTNPLASFRRLATESALGTGRLNGAVQLTEQLQKMTQLNNKAMMCFAKIKYTTNLMKWSFDNFKDKAVSFTKLHTICHGSSCQSSYIQLKKLSRVKSIKH